MKAISLIYLLLGTLGLVGYLAHFNRWPAPFIWLFLLALPYYLATMTYTIVVHPLACFLYAVAKIERKENAWRPILHGLWSAGISAAFLIMVHNGYYLSV